MGKQVQVAKPLHCRRSRAKALAAFVSSLAVAAFFANAQTVQHLSVTVPGGFPGMPVMNGIQRATNGITIMWDGPSGYYQVWQKTNLTAKNWTVWGKATNLVRNATITALSSNAFFRVSGPAPRYAGEQTCAGCHGSVHSTVKLTQHAGAFTNALFVAQGGQTNSTCLVCHTVGYRLPTGFVNKTKTPQLEGVQCESCHGPGANHAANPDDFTVIPRVELAAQVCGGCHSGQFAPPSVAASHAPFFEDWTASPHGAVVPDVLASMSSSPNNISNCGRCHSGSARTALLEGQNPTALTNDFNVAITCAVCHDTHARHVWTNVLSGAINFTNPISGRSLTVVNNELGKVYTNQLNCALASTNDFYLKTSDTFSNKYNPNINICAQCHNHRGAAWTDTARAPHHSPQYNMLLGAIGELTTGPSPGLPSTHSRFEKQCAACHMQTSDGSSGHKFEVASYQLCFNCHANPQGLVQFVTASISQEILQTKSYLDLWATTTAPATLRKYGARAWEYITPGDLSPGGSGPNTTDQALIPDSIKKARFDLYLVLYDGSYGVHNPQYDAQLLQAAQAWIEGELYQ